jgi:hypothetical protein
MSYARRHAVAEFPQALLQSLAVERAAEMERGSQVINGTVLLKLVYEPQPLLRERERQESVARATTDRRNWQSLSGTHIGFDGLGQIGQVRTIKETAQGYFNLESVSNSGHQLGGRGENGLRDQRNCR